MIAVLQAGPVMGEVKYIEPALLKETLIKRVDDREFCINPELSWWADNGRIGSRFQSGEVMYIKVLEEGDDVKQYYTPPEHDSRYMTGSAPWGSKGCSKPDSGSGCSCSGRE